MQLNHGMLCGNVFCGPCEPPPQIARHTLARGNQTSTMNERRLDQAQHRYRLKASSLVHENDMFNQLYTCQLTLMHVDS
eukprot:m.317498 g.317498  ORF g.317498 m.317498 type:complete len:79 (-) comp15984_c0_seq4:387-623(-)